MNVSNQQIINHYQKSMLINPRDNLARLKLAWLHYSQGNHEEAKDLLSSISLIGKEVDVFSLFEKSALKGRSNQPNSNQSVIDLISQGPLHEIYYSIGQEYQRLKAWDKALNFYIESIRSKPNYIYPYYAIRYFPKKINTNNLESILSLYSYIAQEIDSFDIIYFFLGEILTQLRRFDESSQYYQLYFVKKESKEKQNEIACFDHKFYKPQNPDFIVVGVGKCGTTSLYSYLSKHPLVVPTIEKEIHFFTDHFDAGLSWYQSHFPLLPQNQKFITGEATPWYFTGLVQEKIYKLFPKVKLILLLRNPVDRAFSHYNMEKKSGWIEHSFKEMSLEGMDLLRDIDDPIEFTGNSQALLFKSQLLLFGMYFYYLKRWLSVFPKDQLLILKSEQLYEQPSRTMQQVFQFLELPNHQLEEYPNDLPGNYSHSLDSDLREKLSKFYQPHNQKLEEFLGISFNWNN